MRNINLGNADNFVAWGTNGMKNCLDHCKLILKRHGLTEYGSSTTAIQLLKEHDGKLVYASENPKQTYKTAIECIDMHLEKGKPIIVGVNHTLGNKYNEGATDHFVVIYGRELSEDCIHYMYYEVGKTSITAGYNDNDNRFVYIDGNNPEFYDKQSGLRNGTRFDVTQVRPNI
jgi:hypothetical protein